MEWKNMENMKNVFVWRWYHVHVFFGKYEPPWSSILPCQGTLLFHKYVYRTWIQDVMIRKRQYYTRYMKISQVCYFYAMCEITKLGNMFVFHLDITAGNFLDWKIMQMENFYFYLDKKGKIVWYIKIFNLLILICDYLFGKNILWNWDSEYLRSVRHKF